MKSRTKPALRVVAPAQVQLTLPIQGVLKDVKHAFYGLCINAGKQVLAAMMEADRIALCGPKGVPDADRRAVRGGTTRSSAVLGGQRIGVRRPRARQLDAGELELPTFAWAAGTDPLDAATDEACRREPAGRTQGRVASRPRSRHHTPSFNSERDIARLRGGLGFRVQVLDLWRGWQDSNPRPLGS